MTPEFLRRGAEDAGVGGDVSNANTVRKIAAKYG
jgi:hypothetical protein